MDSTDKSLLAGIGGGSIVVDLLEALSHAGTGQGDVEMSSIRHGTVSTTMMDEHQEKLDYIKISPLLKGPDLYNPSHQHPPLATPPTDQHPDVGKCNIR